MVMNVTLCHNAKLIWRQVSSSGEALTVPFVWIGLWMNGDNHYMMQ